MSDGPHRSLPMPKAWKELAYRADNKAFAVEDVRAALPAALAADWQDVPDDVKATVQDVLNPAHPSLFPDEGLERLERCRAATAGAPLGVALVGLAIDALTLSAPQGASLLDVVTNALLGDAFGRSRQMEEHYYRKSNQLRAADLRGRLDGSIAQTDFSSIANIILSNGFGNSTRLPPKQSGLDDGVQLQ